MSASTVSITANPGASTRRRPVEKKQSSAAYDLADAAVAAGNDRPNGSGAEAKDLSHHSIRAESRDAIQVVKKPIASVQSPTRRTVKKPGNGAVPKPPRWMTVIRVFTKNFLLLLVLIGLVQMIRRLILNRAPDGSGVGVISGDFEGKIAEIEGFVKTTVKMMQLQVEVIDRKIETENKKTKDELNALIDEKFNQLDGKNENLEKIVADLGAKKWISKEEMDNFFEEISKAKGNKDGTDVNLDDIRLYAREIMEKEIEKHAADGLGRVDYALASGGAFVMKHSETDAAGKGAIGNLASLINRHRVHKDASKMLRPSFGEPGQCFPLKGNSGFVQIRLRTAVIPEAVTLEHVAKSVAYDRSSAPKDCRISGWLQGQDMTDLEAYNEKRFLLAEFTYDLEKSNAQTFSVLDTAGSSVIDTVRFEFTSNHGSPTHTCIYRLRVHGHEPSSVSMLPTQS